MHGIITSIQNLPRFSTPLTAYPLDIQSTIVASHPTTITHPLVFQHRSIQTRVLVVENQLYYPNLRLQVVLYVHHFTLKYIPIATYTHPCLMSE